MVFDRQGYLYFAIGEWGDTEREQEQTRPQDLSRPEGKIHRLEDDGRTPQDNPFTNEPGATSLIWSYGYRVPEGLTVDKGTDVLWSTEHGPRVATNSTSSIRSNYGWPLVTYDVNHTGTPISENVAAPGMTQPIYYWTPSIVVSVIATYDGTAFPRWRHNLSIGSLKEQSLYRAVVDEQRVIHEELILKDLGRIRDVVIRSDGTIYLLLVEDVDRVKGRILRIVPLRTATNSP